MKVFKSLGELEKFLGVTGTKLEEEFENQKYIGQFFYEGTKVEIKVKSGKICFKTA